LASNNSLSSILALPSFVFLDPSLLLHSTISGLQNCG
jgi:hypothetical protein